MRLHDMNKEFSEGLIELQENLSQEDRELLESWYRDQIALMKENPLSHGFPPHEGQMLLHESDHEMRLLISGNRWGKSVSGMREVLWNATMTHPYHDNRPHDMIWVGFPDFPFYRRVTRKKFFEWCPRDRLIQFHETERWAHVKREDGGVCEIHFLSYDSGREKWQGAAVDLMWLDEEPPEDIYREGMARLIDKRGKMLMTLTPLGGMGWIYDRLYMPAVNGDKNVFLVQGQLAELDETQPYGVGEPKVPHMSKEDIVRFARSIPDADERAIRVFGEFRTRSGIVYKQFVHDVHVVPSFAIPDHWELWAGVDPGWHGFAVCFFAKAPDGRVYVVDEYFSQRESLRDRAESIMERAKALGFDGRDDFLILYVDTEDPQMVTELNIWATERNQPLAFASLDQGLKARKAGVTRIQELLNLEEDRRSGSHVKRVNDQGEPMLYFFDNLRSRWFDGEDELHQSRVVWELTRYLFKKPPRGKEDAPLDEPDGSSAGGAHMMDAMRYGVMARMSAPDALPGPDPTANLSKHERKIWEHAHRIESNMNRWVVE